MLVASDPTCKPASSVLERSNTRTTSYHSWEDGGIGLILRVRYVSVDKGAITKERLTFVKVQPVFPAKCALKNEWRTLFAVGHREKRHSNEC